MPTFSLTDVVKPIYNRLLRPHLPRKYCVYNGVTARGVRLLDATDHLPNYKQGFIDAIHEHVPVGSTVELVGFGRGVSTVACLQAGARHVTAHEAASHMIEMGRETLEINPVSASAVTVKHSLVSEAIGVYGDPGDATLVEPSELCDADVLVLDCEGAERSILTGLGTLPETVIVETHPGRGVPTDVTVDALTDDYEVSRRDYKPDDPEKDVIVGKRTTTTSTEPPATDSRREEPSL